MVLSIYKCLHPLQRLYKVTEVKYLTHILPSCPVSEPNNFKGEDSKFYFHWSDFNGRDYISTGECGTKSSGDI